MPTSAAPLIKLVLAIAAVIFALDALAFRSGAYMFWLEPDSTAGSVVRAIMATREYYDPTRKNILVVGNSKIAEGFSPQIADATSQRADLHFLNLAVNGSTLRVWNYLLREVDPDANRFAAIVVMVDYDFTYELQSLGYSSLEDLSNYPPDTNYLIPILRLKDFVDYPSTFSAPDQRERARRSILFPLPILHDDLLDFATHPTTRINAITIDRPGWIGALSQYGGQDKALPELDVDPTSGMPRTWGEYAAEFKPRLEDYFREIRKLATPDQQAANYAYLNYWIGRIADRYRAKGVPVIVFVPPRGPWKQMLIPPPVIGGPIAELRDAGRILAVPGDAFIELEQPQFFFDTLHLNHAGRERFSQMFARQVAPLIH